MLFTTAILPFVLAASAQGAVIARPVDHATQTIEKRGSTMTGQWDSLVTGTYTLYTDYWGVAQATSGSQSTTFTSLVNDVIAWSTNWTWTGGAGQVKSYSNVVVKQSTGVKLSTISSIPTTWRWSYTGSNIVADVAYDIFTSSTAAGSNEFEIMVWLGAIGGAGPISSTGSAIATPSIAGSSWKLYYGLNGNTKVFSFVAASDITSFNSDLALFLTYLNGQQGFSSSQFVTSIGAGTEPFSGTKAVLVVSAYSASINIGVPSATKSTSTKVSPSTTVPATKSSATAPATTSSHSRCKSLTTATKSTATKSTATSVATPTKSTTTKSVAATATKPTTTVAATGTPVGRYYQCGGVGYRGSTVCVAGSTCIVQNEYYSQCM